MPDLNYGTSTYNRERGNFPFLPVINMIAEEVPTESKTALQSRPGLENNATSMGVGPVKALFQIDGVLSGQLFGVSDNKLYSGSTNVGSIDGTGPAKIDGYETYVFATQGDSLWGYDGTTLTAVATPDNFDVLDLCVGASRLVVVDKGTGKIYWSNALTNTIDALSFATAENSPDKLKACLYIGDTLILFGSETVEFWPVTADADAPFAPLVGRVFPIGIKDTGCAVKFQSTFAWVTNENQVCVSDPTNIISLPDINAKIEASSSVSLWTFRLEGVEFLALRLDTQTFVFSSIAQQWSEFQSYGHTNWLPQCYVSGLFGSAVDGHLMQWTDGFADFDDVLERRFRAGMNIDNGTTPVHNVTIRTNPGRTTYLTGDYADPTLEIRTSRDGGNVWSVWKQRSLGEQGNYRQLVQFRGLGFFSNPGLLIEVRVVDPVPFRVSNITANETYGNI